MQHLSIWIAGYPTNVAIYMYTIFPQISTFFWKKYIFISICIQLVKKTKLYKPQYIKPIIWNIPHLIQFLSSHHFFKQTYKYMDQINFSYIYFSDYSHFYYKYRTKEIPFLYFIRSFCKKTSLFKEVFFFVYLTSDEQRILNIFIQIPKPKNKIFGFCYIVVM